MVYRMTCVITLEAENIVAAKKLFKSSLSKAGTQLEKSDPEVVGIADKQGTKVTTLDIQPAR